MSENSGFFRSDNHDRQYTDEFLAKWVASFVGNGVYNAELEVYANGDDMQVYIAAGRAWINGRIYINDSALPVEISTADGTLNRYTAIVVRADQNNRIISAHAVDGSFSASAVKPQPQRDAEIYDLVLAYVYVAAGATAVRQADITDTRLDSDLCGLVECVVDHVDTDTLAAQMADWFAEYQEGAASDLAEFETTFTEWFDNVKGQLSTDAAGHLQNEIDDLIAAQHKTLTITLSASDGGSLAGLQVSVTDVATGLELASFEYSGQPEAVQLATGASYKITPPAKYGYTQPAPVLGVLTADKAATFTYIRGVRYGFKRSKTDSGTASRITYLFDAVGKTPAAVNLSSGAFNYGGWQEVVDAIVAPVMLNNDGTEAYELDHNDQTKKLDGTASDIANTAFAGNAMVRFSGAFKWVKRYEDATAEYVIFCDCQFDDSYHAYAHTDANGIVGDRFYWGMFKGANISSKLRSIAGVGVMVSQTRNTEVAYAQANGDGYDTIYKSGWDYIADLLTLIAKDDNGQTAFGYGRCATGNSAGVTPGSLKAKPAFYGKSDQTTDVKVLYIEGAWGNYWEGMRGFINANGTIKIKMTPPYNFDGADYHNTGITPGGTNGGYVSAAHVTDLGGYIPQTASGSGTTYYADGLWFNNGQVDYALVGGLWSNGLRCGPRCADLNTAASYTNAAVGSRLSFVPLAAS